MVRMSALIEVNPNLDIFEGKRGQNIQLLLPLIYRFKFAYIDEKLYNYIIYENSMSRGDDTYEKCLSRSNGLHEIKIEKLKRMLMNKGDFEYYKAFTEQYYYHKRCIDALKFNQWDDYNVYFHKLVDEQFIKVVEKALFFLKHPIYVPTVVDETKSIFKFHLSSI